MTQPPLRHGVATVLAAVLLLAQPSAHAQSDITTKLSGFGTLGVTRNLDKSGEYRSASTQYRGTLNDADFGVDSRAGVQADVQFNDMFSATGQMLSVRRGPEDFQPAVEWLFGQAKLDSGLNIRLGRMGVPAYMVSDFRQVGYATPWIRPPAEVYSGMMYHRFDGAQIIYRKSLGDFNLMVQPSVGKSDAAVRSVVTLPPMPPMLPVSMDIDGDIRLDANKLYGVNLTLEYGDWLVRWGTVRSEAKAEVYGTLPMVGRTLLSSGSIFKDNFSGVGLQYDNGKLLVMAEYVTRRSTPINTDGYYLSTAYRIGDWAPYASAAHYKETTPLSGTSKSDSTTLGVRWNAAKNISLKTQLDWVDPSKTAFTAPVPTDSVRIFGVALDFIF